MQGRLKSREGSAVAEVLRSGFANWLVCRLGTSRFRAAWLVLGLGSCFIAQSLCLPAQTASRAKKNDQAASKPPAAESVMPAPAPAPAALPPTQNPSHAPVISWDGNRLTIDAENSSLADILLGIRSRTGASIEMPGSTNAERIAVHLGPAPIRDVLSSLLYGTDFNYVIQASEDDESGLGKVILTSRNGDQS